jgi:hypothetical protein
MATFYSLATLDDIRITLSSLLAENYFYKENMIFANYHFVNKYN